MSVKIMYGCSKTVLQCCNGPCSIGLTMSFESFDKHVCTIILFAWLKPMYDYKICINYRRKML